MKTLILVLIFMAGLANAQAVTVKSGDHANFTRLVLTFPKAVEWALGRTEDGYVVQTSERQNVFDLSEVYKLITKERLKTIWADPVTGMLQLGVGCSCYAIPFEFNANTLVIDIRDGIPPERAVFEQSLTDAKTLPPLNQKDTPSASSMPIDTKSYDWLTAATKPKKEGSRLSFIPRAPFEIETKSAAFRNAVIDELAKAATDGIVFISPKELDRTSQLDGVEIANVNMHSGDHAPLTVGARVASENTDEVLTEKGETCPAANRVNISDWADPNSQLDVLTTARNSIVGEFDQTSAANTEIAIHTYLAFGFGAEARNLISAFQSSTEIDPLAVGISYLTDGELPVGDPFKGMQTCENAAALWSLLAAKNAAALSGLNGNSVAQSFLALPQPLKLALAQKTVDGLLQAGDRRNAEIVRAALGRAAPEGAPITPLVDAELAMHEGNYEKAEARLDTISGPIMAADALVAMVETRFEQRRKVDDADVLALQAYAFEAQGGPDDAQFQTAVTHAQALSGHFSDAIATSNGNIALRADVFSLLAELGQPSDFLQQIVGGALLPSDQISDTTRESFVRNLIALGMPNAAATWLPINPENIELAAEVALANQDGRTALRVLASDMRQADPKTLARAFEQTGSYGKAASVLRNAGQTEEASRLERWDGNWEDIAKPGLTTVDQTPASDPTAATTPQSDSVWSRLAALRMPTAVVSDRAPLASGKLQLEQSAITRELISNLLVSTPVVVK